MLLCQLLLRLLVVHLVVLLDLSHLEDDVMAQGAARTHLLLVEDQLEEVVGHTVGHVVLLGVLPVLRRREDQVQTEFEGTVGHSRDDSLESSGGGLETGVGIDLDEPGLEVLIDHEVQSKNLEGRQPIPLSKKLVGGLDGISAYPLELRTNFLYKVMIFLRMIEIFLEIMIAEFVSILILAVLVAIDLDGIIGEMYELVLRIVELVFIATRSDVPLLVPISLDLAVLYR
jgi:hypothetical protein